MQPPMDLRVERNIAVPMRDGVVLRADVFRPEPDGRYPVLLCRTPYSKAFPAFADWLDPIRAASAGYVVVIQDVRGRFDSEGLFRPFHQEIDDGFDSVEWAARQPWSNGRVGMYGPSYLGATQWLAASAQAPNLQAIFPSLTASDYFDGWTFQGGAFALSFNIMWTAIALAVPELDRTSLPASEASAVRNQVFSVVFDHWPAFRHLPVRDLAAFAHDALVPFYREWLDHPQRDDFWESIDIEHAHPRIHTPALNLGGWFDIFVRGTLRNFTGMRANGPTGVARHGQRLLVGPWIHGAGLGGRAGQTAFGQSATIAAGDLHLRWFDRWLRDADNGVDREPPVRVFTMGVNRWQTFAAWPPPAARPTPYYLHGNGSAATANGDGVLSPDLPGDEPPDSLVYDPADPCPTVGGALYDSPMDLPAGQWDQSRIEARHDVLCYTSPILDGDFEVTGDVSAHLWVASSARDTDFTAKLVDVQPDGTPLNICDGIVRARYRAGFGMPVLLSPGIPAELTIDLAGTSHTFLTAHRVRIEVSSSNFPRFDRNTNTGGVIALDARPAVATNTVFHDRRHPSCIILPVVEHP